MAKSRNGSGEHRNITNVKSQPRAETGDLKLPHPTRKLERIYGHCYAVVADTSKPQGSAKQFFADIMWKF